MNTDTRNIQDEFIGSSKDILETIESLLIKLEKSYERKEPLNIDIVNNLFRQFHTLKGNSSFFNLPNVEKLSHAAETILNDLRSLTIEVDYELIDSIIDTRDFLLLMLAYIEKNGDDTIYEKDTISRIKRLEILNQRQLRKNKNIKPITPTPNIDEETKPRFGIFEDEEKPKPRFGIFTNEEEKTESKKPSFGIFEDDEVPPEEEKTYPQEKPIFTHSIKKDIRIDTQKLDVLIDTIGELVIAESLVTENPDLGGLYLENFSRSAEHLKKIVKSLQDISLSLRMVPIESVFQRMERLVRDISRKKDKKINLNLIGTDTEVDKNILENISDPLMHLIRNAIDHGIEEVEARKKIGKSEIGEVTLEAYNAGSVVVIEVRDDGRGLDKEKILNKAIKMGFVKRSNDLLEEDIFNLIFIPGFTTTDRITDISGRGVGMDVVKKNISNLNGEIEVSSNFKKGTTFTIRVPLTLSIIDGMIVHNQNKFYILPAVDIVETLELKQVHFESVDKYTKIFRYRNRIVPSISIEGSINNKNKSLVERSTEKYLIIVESKKQYLGITLDNIIVNQPVVIKSLPEMFKNIQEYSGCTILGNGRVAFILDIKHIIEKYYSSPNIKENMTIKGKQWNHQIF